MRSLLTFLPGLACAGGMAMMMWMMTRSSPNRSTGASHSQPDAETQLADLRDEVARLRDEVGSPSVEPPAH
ncbi:MAG: hypothetical protein ACRD29_13775 [Acidimicrobiales bacterium]